MSIHKIGSDLIRPFGPKGPKPAEQESDGEAKEGSKRSDRSDRAGFSAEGLAMAALVRNVEAELSSERLEQIESRVASGFYDQPEVAGEVARRLLEAGELDATA